VQLEELIRQKMQLLGQGLLQRAVKGRRNGYKGISIACEGACKYVVAKRLKQSGMIWTRDGSAAVLALRTTWLNAEREQLWSANLMPLKYSRSI